MELLHLKQFHGVPLKPSLVTLNSSSIHNMPNFRRMSRRNTIYATGSSPSIHPPPLPPPIPLAAAPPSPPPPPTLRRKRKRYRKERPGESIGIVEEMRFVAMKLRPKTTTTTTTTSEVETGKVLGEGDSEVIWMPTIKGYLKYLVDSSLVFTTLDKIVDEAAHVEYADFRNTGLERSDALSRDLEWFSEQGHAIPQPSATGIAYADYLNEVSERSSPAFLCNFYNIYFSHVTGGVAISKQVSEKILMGKELEFCKWEGDMPELLKNLRDKLNMLSDNWSRDVRSKCLKEAAKSFQFSGRIIRLIIL